MIPETTWSRQIGRTVLTAAKQLTLNRERNATMDRTRDNEGENSMASTARAVGETAATAAQRMQESLEQGKAALADMQEMVTEKTRECMRTTDLYVRDNPWQAVGIAAGLGLIVGLLLRRR
jgi:ElaB/YqjD/DUF883 family membrane-anchored ribosome-binding protein